MTIRTSRKTVTFRRPFVLGGVDEALPAGAYSVRTDVQLSEGVSFPAYRRISTRIHLHAEPGHPSLTRALTIDPNELDAALLRDQAPAALPVARDAGQASPEGPTESRGERSDRQAIERGEDEGMTVHPG